jgi:hypothetical protein
MLARACPYLGDGWLPKMLGVLSSHFMEDGEKVNKSFRYPVGNQEFQVVTTHLDYHNYIDYSLRSMDKSRHCI